jgi:hypothetical protein
LSKKKKIVLAGQIVLDTIIYRKMLVDPLKKSIKKPIPVTLGGPPFFGAYIAKKITKIFPWIDAPLLYAYSCPKALLLLENFFESDLILENLVIRPQCPNFRLIYAGDKSERFLSLKNPPLDYNPLDFDWDMNQEIITILGSVYHEFDNKKIIETIRSKSDFIALDAQGFFRYVTSNGDIIFKRWKNPEILANIDCLKISEKEASFLGLGINLHQIVEKLLDFSIKIVLLTRGRKGVILGVKKSPSEDIHIYKIPTYPVTKLINETGAGDILLFSFIAYLIIYKNEVDAIAFATSVVSFFIENDQLEKNFTTEKVVDRKKRIISQITEF